MNYRRLLEDWGSLSIGLTFLSTFIAVLSVSLSLSSHVAPCQWTCFNQSCSDQIYCPRKTFEECQAYFNGSSAVELERSTSPVKDPRNSPDCTLFLRGNHTNIVLTRPFYGMFINTLILNNLTYDQPGNQNVIVSYNQDEVNDGYTLYWFYHTLSFWNDNITYSPDLTVHFGSVWDDQYSTFFIGSIDLQVNPVPVIFVGGIVFMVVFFISAIVLLLIRHRFRNVQSYQMHLLST